MRRFLIILGFITSILAVILSVSPLSNIAFIPAVLALICGFIAFYLSRQKQYPTKSIQLILLLTIISLTITTYKAVFNVAEVGNIESLELKVKESEKEAIEELEGLDLDDMEIDTEDEPNFSEIDSLP